MGVKYIWWGYVKQMVRVYPDRKREYEDVIAKVRGPVLDDTPKAPNTNGDPIGSLLAKVEQTATYKDYSAVHSALEICKSINPAFMRFVELYYWQSRRKYSIEDVADELFFSPETVRRWNKRLLYAVAQYRGLMDV